MNTHYIVAIIIGVICSFQNQNALSDVVQDALGKPKVEDVLEGNFGTIMNILDYGGYGEEDIIKSDARKTSGVLCHPQTSTDDAGERLYGYHLDIEGNDESLYMQITQSGIIRYVDFGRGMKPAVEVGFLPKIKEKYKLIKPQCLEPDVKEDSIAMITKNIIYAIEKLSGFHRWNSVSMTIVGNDSEKQVTVYISTSHSGIPVYGDDMVVVYDYGEGRLLRYSYRVLSRTLPDIPKKLITDQEASTIATQFIKKLDDTTYKPFVSKIEWPFGDYIISQSKISKMFFHPNRVDAKNEHHSAYKNPIRPSQVAVLVYEIECSAMKKERSKDGTASGRRFSVLVDALSGTVLGIYQLW